VGTLGAGMDLAAALAYLDAHANLEAVPAREVDRLQTRLDRMRALVGLMGDPQAAYPVVHLTGTNGKTSTARMVTALLAAKGLSVGTYTSPHLQRVNERVSWNGEPISDGALVELIEAVAAIETVLDERPSYFELLTAGAFRWFADVAVDVAVVEVGMGGGWDATNMADGQVAVVTNVELDHVEYLGPDVASIAAEKAGIVKPGSHLVLGDVAPPLDAAFRSAGAAEVWAQEAEFGCEGNRLAVGGRLLDLRTPGGYYEDVYLPLHGSHQGGNAAVALATAEAFFGGPLDDDVVAEGFASVTTPGRMEIVSRRPLVVLDGAHNPAGARAAAATLDEEFTPGPGGGRVLVVGMMAEKDPAEMLGALEAGAARLVVACAADSPRALPADDVAAAVRALGVEAVVARSVAAAVDQALAAASPDDVVLVTGSLYVVGEARTALLSSSSSSSS
jgi:dihydrofolate synthase/folylpolyglutamate synthase